MELHWSEILKLGRKRSRLSQAELGRVIGRSASSIHSYELRRRVPSVKTLHVLLDVLALSAEEKHSVIHQLGELGDPMPSNTSRSYFLDGSEAQSVIEQVSWPAFILNNLLEVIAVNRPAQALWGIDWNIERAKRTRAQLNLLSVAAEGQFASRIGNWDECVGTLLASMKGRGRARFSLEDPGPYIAQVLREFAQTDPVYLKRLMDLFEKTKALKERVRWTYSVVWRDESLGELTFKCLVSPANELDALTIDDWIPINAETWTALDRLKQRQQPGRPLAEPTPK